MGHWTVHTEADTFRRLWLVRFDAGVSSVRVFGELKDEVG